jgi:tetratricopeptide (TPR) repeat protein
MSNKLAKYSLNSTPKKVLDSIALVRERKGKGKDTLNLIEKALVSAHDYVVRLILEKFLVYQHEVMEDRSKPRQDKGKQKQFINKMESTVLEASNYVEKHNLVRWRSRVYRYLGRLSDYKKDFKKAAFYYRKAIKFSRKDPAFVNEGIPYHLEYEAFLAYSLLMSGNTKKSLSLLKKLYKKFDQTKEGKSLKSKDYPTWVIWKTGIPIRVGFWFLKDGKGFGKKDLMEWLNDAEKLTKLPKTSDRWVGKVDFQFRKDEIASIKRSLKKL